MNLNTSAQPHKPLERFNPMRPQGNAPSFRPSFGTIVAGLLAILVALCIGAFAAMGIAGGGSYPDIRGMFARKKDAASEVKDAKYQEAVRKGTEEEIKDLLSEYQSRWNKGWTDGARPSSVFASGMTAQVNEDKAKGDDIAARFTSSVTIAGTRLDNFVLMSDSKAFADGTFQLQRTVSQEKWYAAGEEKPVHPDKRIVVERFVRYSFQLTKAEGGWRIAQQTWLEKTPARIRTEEDTTAEAIAMPEGAVIFRDLRPNKQQLQARYDSMASEMNYGRFPAGEFYSNYKLMLRDGSERTKEQAKARLEKLYAKVGTLSFKATVEGVSQIEENRAYALVTYRLNLTPNGSQNVYTISWQDRDTWGRSTQGGWYINATERQSESSLGETYGY